MTKRWIILAALTLLLPAAAGAQAPVGNGVGPRVGFSIDPDQLVVGGHLTFGEIAPNLTFDPNLELGFGDDVTVVAVGLDLHYHFLVPNSRWQPYTGAGLGVNFLHADLPPGADDSETEVGGNFLVGAGAPTTGGNRFFGELKFGLGDVPTLKMLVGWTFHM